MINTIVILYAVAMVTISLIWAWIAVLGREAGQAVTGTIFFIVGAWALWHYMDIPTWWEWLWTTRYPALT